MVGGIGTNFIYVSEIGFHIAVFILNICIYIYIYVILQFDTCDGLETSATIV